MTQQMTEQERQARDVVKQQTQETYLNRSLTLSLPSRHQLNNKIAKTETAKQMLMQSIHNMGANQHMNAQLSKIMWEQMVEKMAEKQKATAEKLIELSDLVIRTEMKLALIEEEFNDNAFILKEFERESMNAKMAKIEQEEEERQAAKDRDDALKALQDAKIQELKNEQEDESKEAQPPEKTIETQSIEAAKKNKGRKKKKGDYVPPKPKG